MSAAAKRRVDRATSNLTGTRCLIENTDESNAVEYVHCLPRSTKSELLDRLEFAWNLSRFTSNVDTRANVFRLSSKFYKLFDSNRWLLLPELSIINTYDNAIKKNEKFPIINVRTMYEPFYKYTIVAHSNMLRVPIHRQNSLSNDEDQPPLDFISYHYPYDDFPIIISHVHPRFVICNTGMKLLGPTMWPDREDARDVIRIQNIWKAWCQIINKGQSRGKTFYMNPRNDDLDIGEDDSVRTGNHRVLRERKLPEQRGSPTPPRKSCKQQRLADDGAWLDDETLCEFDQQISTHVEDMKSKKDLVLEWLNGVSTGVKENSSLDVTMAVAGALLEHP